MLLPLLLVLLLLLFSQHTANLLGQIEWVFLST